MFRKNVAGQFICFQLNSIVDGTGLTGATVSVRRCIDGTFAAGGGTVTENTGAGSSAGFYKYAMSQADMNGNNISFAFSATNAIRVEKTLITTAADPTDSVRLGLTSLPNAAAGATGGVPLSIDNVGSVLLGIAGSLALTEGYPTLHATGTLAQLIYEIRAFLMEKVVSNNTLTVNRIDGTTMAETFKMNSATLPTSLTRVT